MIHEDGPSRLIFTGLGVLLLLVFLVIGPLSSVFYLGIPPCEDDLSFSTVNTDMSITSNPSTETVTAVHEGGEILTEKNTVRLFLRFNDAETGKTATVTWSPAGLESFPVKPGETVTVQWKSAGAWVSSGDTVRVIWRGYETNRPKWCLQNRPGNSTLAKTTL